MTTRRAYVLWLIDDSDGNHRVAAATVAALPWVHFEGFYTGAEAVEAFTARQAEGGQVPDAVLMDYYLGGERGDQVTRDLRAAERTARPLIIGYSSVMSASAAIVSAGADLVLRKHADQRGINPSLSRWLRGLRPA
jgi:CheY-like chemotaxis protein